MYVGKYKGYPIFVSDKPDKKYYALVDGKKKYFGAYGYQHFFDKFRFYKGWDHGDSKRRQLYKSRHEKNRHKEGTPGWFADQILW